MSASDLASIAEAAADAQVILTSTELADAVRAAIGRNFAEVIEVVNYFDVEEIGEKLEASLALTAEHAPPQAVSSRMPASSAATAADAAARRSATVPCAPTASM